MQEGCGLMGSTGGYHSMGYISRNALMLRNGLGMQQHQTRMDWTRQIGEGGKLERGGVWWWRLWLAHPWAPRSGELSRTMRPGPGCWSALRTTIYVYTQTGSRYCDILQDRVRQSHIHCVFGGTHCPQPVAARHCPSLRE